MIRSDRRHEWLTVWTVLLLSQGLVAAAQAAPAFRKTITINAGQVTGGPLT